MLKIILSFSLILLLSTNSFCQKEELSYPVKEGKAFFIDTSNLSINKIEAFKRAKEWVVNNFNSNDVIKMEEKDAGKIIVKGIISVSSLGKDNGYFNFKMTIKINDNFYRCSITNLVHENIKFRGVGAFEKGKPASINYSKAQWVKMKEQAISSINATFANLKKSMTSTS